MQDLKIRLETLDSVLEELKPIFEDHYKEIAVYTDKIDLDPDYGKYRELEKLGVLHLVVMRKAEEIIGYCVLFKQPHLHYQKDVWVSMDILYLKPEFRKAGYGSLLVDFVEGVGELVGASVVLFSTKVKQPFDGLMEAKGYDLIERVYTKCLKE